MRTALNLTAVVLLATVPFPEPSAADGGESQAVERMSGQLSPEGFAKVARGGRFSLPKFRVYDGEGRQVYEMNGFSPALFTAQVQKTLDEPNPLDGAPSLEQELAGIVGTDGGPLAALPDSDFILVDYWAEWCKPCKLLKKQLETILAANTEFRLTLLEVEADPEKASPLGEAQGPVNVIDMSKLDPETARKLQSGELSQEEMLALFREAHEAGAVKQVDPDRLTPEQREDFAGGELSEEEMRALLREEGATGVQRESVHVVDVAKLDPETVRKLQSGELSPEERNALFREVHEAGAMKQIDPSRLSPEQREKLEGGLLTPEELAEIIEKAEVAEN